MRSFTRFALLLSLATLWGCSSTVTVPVPPRVDLQGFGTVGLLDFASNSNATINAQSAGPAPACGHMRRASASRRTRGSRGLPSALGMS